MNVLKVALVLIVLAAGGALAIIYSGAFNVAATEPHSAFGRWLFSTTMVQSVAANAEDIEAPALTPELANQGFRYYDGHCKTCHGAPGAEPAPLAQGMRPPPPELAVTASRWRPREIFWITKHGIRMSGMPAWAPQYDDDTLWQITAFVHQLPDLTPSDYQQRVDALSRAAAGGSATTADGEGATGSNGSARRTQASGQGAAGGATGATEHTVAMTNDLRYEPNPLTIAVGDTVTWTNPSSLTHTITADPELAQDAENVQLPDGAETFHSGNIEPEGNFSRRFTLPGRYRYFCVPHEAAGMVGELVVEE